MEYVGVRAAKIKDAFLVEAAGDSMCGKTPRGGNILPGDLLLVEPHREIADGDVVLVTMGDDATIKVFFRSGENVLLKPTNPKHATITVNRAEFEAKGGSIFRVRVQVFQEL